MFLVDFNSTTAKENEEMVISHLTYELETKDVSIYKQMSSDTPNAVSDFFFLFLNKKNRKKGEQFNQILFSNGLAMSSNTQ